MQETQLHEAKAEDVFTPEQTQVIELTLEEFDATVVKAKSFMRLLDNEDFIQFISEDYIEADAQRIGGLLTTTNNKVIQNQPKLIEQLVSKRYLRAWLEFKYNEFSPYLVQGEREELIRQMNEETEDGE